MHEHLSRELFRSIHKGWRNPGDLATIAIAHLFELCPHCREEFETWRGELGEGVARDEADYDGALQKVRERTAANDLGVETEEARVEGDRRESRSRAQELLALPDDQRLEWIRTEKHGHSGLLLAEVLIEECRRTTPGYPHEGYTLADLARVVLHHAPVTGYAVELYALALAHLANAIRVLGDLPRADQVLGDARYILRCQVGDRLLRAEIDSLEGSLRMGQFRFRDATPMLLRPLTTFRLEGDWTQTAVILAKLGRNHRGMCEFERALALLAEAETSLRRAETPSPFLLRIIKNLRCNTLADLGDVEAAIDEIEGSVGVGYRDPLLDLRTWWSIAMINRRRGALEDAEEIYRMLVEEFETKEFENDLAHARFELACVCLKQQRAYEALELIDQVEGTFTRLRIRARVAEVHELRRRAARA